MTTIVVFAEQSGGQARRASLECVSAAQATGSEVVVVTFGAGAEASAAGFGKAGATQVICLSDSGAFSPDSMASDVAKLVQEFVANAFLAAATVTGKDIAPRVAAHLDATLLSDVTGFSASAAGFTVVRPWLAGKAVATLTVSGGVLCATTRPNVFAQQGNGAAPKVTQRPATAGGKATVTALEAKTAGKLDVKEASVVVSGGRGMKGPEHFGLIENLAAAFGNAATGASRAVVDAGWRPHAEQVGQTGKTVAPKLYVAVGISGAIQHLAGMRTSKVIVAINKDKDAPIFKIADYGIVGDAFEILPALTAAVKAARAHS